MAAVTSAPARTLTRDDVVRLGRAGRAWEFMPIALEALRLAPSDAGIRLLLGANAASLGLGTIAQEQLDALGADPASSRDVRGLAVQVDRLGTDQYAQANRVRTLERNLEVLAARGTDLRSHMDRWIRGDQGREWLRASDGNLIRRRGSVFECLGDHVGGACRFVQSHLIRRPGELPRPLTIEGMDPPWLMIEAAKTQPRSADGHQARLTVVQADVMEAMDGLAHVDITELLGEDRVRVLIGSDAALRLAQDLRGRFETQIIGPFIPISSVRVRAVPSIQRVIGEAEAEQQAEHRRLSERVAACYVERNEAWWARRFGEALSGAPLRVLVPTCRYSTYIQHASRELVEAIRGMGHEATLLIEPDDQSRFSSLAYLRALERLVPDLVILINYTRAHLGSLFPSNLPFVCWVQDAMGHQYDARIGGKLGRLDFVVGHLAEELFQQFGYPRERTMVFPVVTSARTFHAGPVGLQVQRRFECEIAWVSHHSEDPADMHERLRDEVGPELAPILDRLQPTVERIARDSLGVSTGRQLREATAASVIEARGAADATIVTQLFRLYAKPLADRIHRHQTLEWAAEIADRRGWRLRVHGRGWDRHPRFRRYDAGAVSHDDELRACYQCAGVHLHMTIHNIVHQRVMECALSGGLPICRLNAETVGLVVGAMKLAACHGEPVKVESIDGGTRLGYLPGATAESAALARELERAGAPVPEILWVNESRLAEYRAGEVKLERRADWLLGDLASTTFTSREGLERIIDRAMADPDWRRRTSEAIAGRVRERLTDDAFVRHVLRLVGDSLEAGS